MLHAMTDIETLDTAPTSVILSVGSVKFDPFTFEDPYDKKVWRIDLEQQLGMGRTTSEATLEWWAQQDSEIRDRALDNTDRISVEQFCKEFNAYMSGPEKIWAQGVVFDIGIIEDLYRMIGHHTSWPYWKIRDSRTLLDLMPTDPRKEIQQDLHDAGEDAYWQAVCVQKTMSHFGLSNNYS